MPNRPIFMEFLSSDVVVVAGSAGISALRAHRQADPRERLTAAKPPCLQLGQPFCDPSAVFGK